MINLIKKCNKWYDKLEEPDRFLVMVLCVGALCCLIAVEPIFVLLLFVIMLFRLFKY